MSNHFKDEVIDLTSSFTLADHRALSNVIIDLDSDESFDRIWKAHSTQKEEKESSKAYNLNTNNKDSIVTSKKTKERTSSKIGDCPICFDELGNNPLASTKCGHVYCLKCLEQSLKVEKRCPTCRRLLKGTSAYHPLYLSRH